MTEFQKALIERLDAIVAEIKATRELLMALEQAKKDDAIAFHAGLKALRGGALHE